MSDLKPRHRDIFLFLIGGLPPIALALEWLPREPFSGALLLLSSSYLLVHSSRRVWRHSEISEVSFLTASVNLWLGNLVCWLAFGLQWRESLRAWMAYVIMTVVGIRISREQQSQLAPESKAYFALWLSVITDGAFFHPRVFLIGIGGLVLWIIKNGFWRPCWRM